MKKREKTTDIIVKKERNPELEAFGSFLFYVLKLSKQKLTGFERAELLPFIKYYIYCTGAMAAAALGSITAPISMLSAAWVSCGISAAAVSGAAVS